MANWCAQDSLSSGLNPFDVRMEIKQILFYVIEQSMPWHSFLFGCHFTELDRSKNLKFKNRKKDTITIRYAHGLYSTYTTKNMELIILMVEETYGRENPRKR